MSSLNSLVGFNFIDEYFTPTYKYARVKKGAGKGKLRKQYFPPPYIKNMRSFKTSLNDDHVDSLGYSIDLLSKIPTKGDLEL